MDLKSQENKKIIKKTVIELWGIFGLAVKKVPH
jgi:hypothetical protein